MTQFRNLIKEMLSSELDEINLSTGDARVETLYDHFLDAKDSNFFRNKKIDEILTECDN